MKYSKLTLFVLIILLLSPTFTSSALCYSAEVKKVSVRAVAVSRTEEGKLVGTITTIEIAVLKPGNGTVYISTTPLTELDMQAAAKVAAIVASELADVPYVKYDFLINVRAPTVIVGGPSASALMAVAMYALLKNLTLNTTVYMTGMVNPDGSIGPVGGILEKAEAVARAGGKVFLIPLGQRYVVTYETIKQVIGPITRIVRKPKVVDVVEYARKKWGLKVIEVGSVEEALQYFTGIEMELTYPRKLKLPPTVAMHFRDVAEYLLSRVSSILEEKKLREVYGSEVKRVEDEVRKTESYLDRGLYYVAASMAFRTYIDALELKLLSEVRDLSPDKAIEVLEEKFRELSNEFRNCISDLRSHQEVSSVSDVSVLIAVAERLSVAETLIERIKGLLQEAKEGMYGVIRDIVSDLAYLQARLETAMLWMRLLGKVSSGVATKHLPIDNLAYILFDQARSIYSYTSEIVREVGLAEALERFIAEAEWCLKKAEYYLHSGDFLMTIALSIRSITCSSAAMNILSAQREEVMEYLIEYAKKMALYNTEKCLKRGIVPIVSISYIELANETRDSTLKLVLYRQASIYSYSLALLLRLSTLNITLPKAPIPEVPKPANVPKTPGGKQKEVPSTSRAMINKLALAILVTLIIAFIVVVTVALTTRKTVRSVGGHSSPNLRVHGHFIMRKLRNT
ncbi:MAG: hypothetical protein DRJ40_07415 [Thermoprotei archaeon]|nr:MAG: hypothetical protein DRJ40_07415 [Thermoprotei archaeon]